jgi:hypothetical protein
MDTEERNHCGGLWRQKAKSISVAKLGVGMNHDLKVVWIHSISQYLQLFQYALNSTPDPLKAISMMNLGYNN